jgi:hypothetical protein
MGGVPLEKIIINYENSMRWQRDEVACLHVKRNHLVGCSYIVIID